MYTKDIVRTLAMFFSLHKLGLKTSQMYLFCRCKLFDTHPDLSGLGKFLYHSMTNHIMSTS